MSFDYSKLDNWFYQIGVNIIPVDSQNKKPLINWLEWQNNPISIELYEQWKSEGLFDKGFAIITGKIHRDQYKDKNLICIDIDNKKGIDEILSFSPGIKTIDELAKKTLVVQHEDSKEERAHIYFITDILISKKCGISYFNKDRDIDKDTRVPAIEIKSDSSTFMIGPSCIHKNGYEYKVIGTRDILVLDEEKTLKLENTLDQIYQRYSASSSNTNQSLSLPPTDEMDKEDFIVYDGNNRHLHTLRKIESWYSKSNKTLTFDELFTRTKKWNDVHCKGPLDDNQISELVKQGMDYINKRNIFESTKSNIESENYSNQKTKSLLNEGDKLLD